MGGRQAVEAGEFGLTSALRLKTAVGGQIIFTQRGPVPCIGQLLDSTRGAPDAGDLAISARFGLARWARALPASETLIAARVSASSSIRCRTRRSMSSRMGRTPWGVEAGGVVEGVPGFVAFCRGRWGGHRRSYGDHDVAGADGFVGPRVGELLGDVDASLSHGGDGGRVDLVYGFGSARPGDGMVAGQSLKEAEGHLGPAGVVAVQDQDGRLAVAM
jgi:hypothetical protein